MQSQITSDFFSANRRRLREQLNGTAPIVMTANGLLQRGADSTFAFAQDASFWYMSGIDEPDIVLVMDGDSEYLIVPPRSASRQAFDGSVAFEPLSRRSGIRDIYDDTEGWNKLGSRLKKIKQVATLAAPPHYVEQYGMYTNPARAALASRLKAANGQLDMLDIGPHIARLRMVKQAPELTAIEAAIAVTSETLKQVTGRAARKKYVYEYEIEAKISEGFRRRGAAGHAFEPIVAGGVRACTLHNVSNSGELAANELLLLDVGANVDHYAADITRTISLAAPTQRQTAVFAAVLDVQSHAMSLLKPGCLLREYEKAVEHYMGEKLRELGLIKTIEHSSVRQFYPHATSHFLGLNVHDVGDYDRPLEPGVVLTVEPGIYIPREGIGIRVEDDVLITDGGIRVLSDALPKKLQ